MQAPSDGLLVNYKKSSNYTDFKNLILLSVKAGAIIGKRRKCKCQIEISYLFTLTDQVIITNISKNVIVKQKDCYANFLWFLFIVTGKFYARVELMLLSHSSKRSIRTKVVRIAVQIQNSTSL